MTIDRMSDVQRNAAAMQRRADAIKATAQAAIAVLAERDEPRIIDLKKVVAKLEGITKNAVDIGAEAAIVLRADERNQRILAEVESRAVRREDLERDSELARDRCAARTAGGDPHDELRERLAHVPPQRPLATGDDDEDEDGSIARTVACPACGEANWALGPLGSIVHYRCRACGLEYAQG